VSNFFSSFFGTFFGTFFGVQFLIGCLVLLLAFCGLCFDYNLDTYFGKNIPWYVDCLAGLFTAPINVPAAVLGLVLVKCDVPTPIIFPDDPTDS
jgi:hypothetical protein